MNRLEFDDDFPASFASAPPPPPAVSAPPPPPPVVSPPPPPPVIAPQEVRPPINLPHPQPAIPKYVAEEGVLATPPPITGSEVSLSDGVDDMLNGLLDDMKSGQNRQQNRRDAVMSEFNSMAATSKASTPPPAPANSNIRPPKKTYAFPKQNTTDSQQLSEQPAIEDDSQDNQPLIGMQPIIIKKGTVKKLKRK